MITLILVALVSSVSWAGPSQDTGSQPTTKIQAKSKLPGGFPQLQFTLNPTYHSIGLKLGHVLNVHRVRPVLSTYEGDLMLGFGSGPGQVTDRPCVEEAREKSRETSQKAEAECRLFSNPWPFSFLDKRFYDVFRQINDEPVLIYYVNYYAAPSYLLTKTKNKMLGVFQTMPDLKLVKSYHVSTWKSIHSQAGHSVGRIVQASVESPIRKTFEVVIQESQHSENFRAMTVNDATLFRYITYVMLTGRPARIDYIRLYPALSGTLSFVFNFMTQYRVVGVELL